MLTTTSYARQRGRIFYLLCLIFYFQYFSALAAGHPSPPPMLLSSRDIPDKKPSPLPTSSSTSNISARVAVPLFYPPASKYFSSSPNNNNYDKNWLLTYLHQNGTRYNVSTQEILNSNNSRPQSRMVVIPYPISGPKGTLQPQQLQALRRLHQRRQLQQQLRVVNTTTQSPLSLAARNIVTSTPLPPATTTTTITRTLLIGQQQFSAAFPPRQSLSKTAAINFINRICQPDMFGTQQHPFSCTHFVQCFAGRGVEQACPPGTVFDGTMRVCDGGAAVCNQDTLAMFRSQVALEEYAWQHKVQASSNFANNLLFDEQQQHRRALGRRTLSAAAAGSGASAEDVAESSILMPALASSSNIVNERAIFTNAGQFDQATAFEQCSTFPDGLYPIQSSSDCSLYIQCRNQQATLLSCPEPSMFDAEQQQCVLGGSCRSIPMGLSSSSSSSAAALVSATSFICPRRDGLFRDRNEPQAFYNCWNYRSHRQLCPDGLWFNEHMQWCDFKANVLLLQQDVFNYNRIHGPLVEDERPRSRPAFISTPKFLAVEEKLAPTVVAQPPPPPSSPPQWKIPLHQQQRHRLPAVDAYAPFYNSVPRVPFADYPPDKSLPPVVFAPPQQQLQQQPKTFPFPLLKSAEGTVEWKSPPEQQPKWLVADVPPPPNHQQQQQQQIFNDAAPPPPVPFSTTNRQLQQYQPPMLPTIQKSNLPPPTDATATVWRLPTKPVEFATTTIVLQKQQPPSRRPLVVQQEEQRLSLPPPPTPLVLVDPSNRKPVVSWTTAIDSNMPLNELSAENKVTLVDNNPPFSALAAAQAPRPMLQSPDAVMLLNQDAGFDRQIAAPAPIARIVNKDSLAGGGTVAAATTNDNSFKQFFEAPQFLPQPADSQQQPVPPSSHHDYDARTATIADTAAAAAEGLPPDVPKQNTIRISPELAQRLEQAMNAGEVEQMEQLTQQALRSHTAPKNNSSTTIIEIQPLRPFGQQQQQVSAVAVERSALVAPDGGGGGVGGGSGSQWSPPLRQPHALRLFPLNNNGSEFHFVRGDAITRTTTVAIPVKKSVVANHDVVAEEDVHEMGKRRKVNKFAVEQYGRTTSSAFANPAANRNNNKTPPFMPKHEASSSEHTAVIIIPQPKT